MSRPKVLPVQVATIPEFCPVCRDSDPQGRMALDLLDGQPPFDVVCPHCTDATRLLKWIDESVEKKE